MIDTIGKSHEISEIIDTIHHIRILLDDVSECLGIDKGYRKLLVESIVIPVHLGKPQYSQTCFMPSTRAGKSAKQER
ncbi:hypothetical protein [Thiolapillus sp.]|uniref:hypothetical protein n=1 Tax=Thiolapillus sp. TaxID=2017437 RepID=UPI0025F67BB2|nr:hypothetical protein [Thiolapillus sp.]